MPSKKKLKSNKDALIVTTSADTGTVVQDDCPECYGKAVNLLADACDLPHLTAKVLQSFQQSLEEINLPDDTTNEEFQEISTELLAGMNENLKKFMKEYEDFAKLEPGSGEGFVPSGDFLMRKGLAVYDPEIAALLDVDGSDEQKKMAISNEENCLERQQLIETVFGGDPAKEEEFDQKARLGYLMPEFDAEPAVTCCCICLDNETEPENLLHFCDGCNFYAHWDCLGLEKFDDDWLCQFCQDRKNGLVPGNTAKCFLCDKDDKYIGGGIMFKVFPEKGNSKEFFWVHGKCALYSGVFSLAGGGQYLKPFDTESLSKGNCKVCKKKTSFVIKCNADHCKYRSHVSCGVYEGRGVLFYATALEGEDDLFFCCQAHKKLLKDNLKPKDPALEKAPVVTCCAALDTPLSAVDFLKNSLRKK